MSSLTCRHRSCRPPSCIAANPRRARPRPRAWKNPAYRRARRLGQLPAEPAETGAYPALEQPEAVIPDHVPAEWLPGNGTSYLWS